MPQPFRTLLANLLNSSRAKTPLSRLTFLTRVASEDETNQFGIEMLVKAFEAKHTGHWETFAAFLEQWEDLSLHRLAKTADFPPLSKPWTPFNKPLREAKIALLTSGGLFLNNQNPFELTNDPTYREIPRGTQQADIRVAHRGYDTKGPLTDMNCMFPLSRFLELEQEGFIGSLASTNYSFNGSAPDLAALEEWPHEAARTMRDEGVDAILLTPA